MAYINGTHGEYTRSDDFRLSESQRLVLQSVGIAPSDLYTINKGRWGLSAIQYAAFTQPWYVYVEELFRPSPSVELEQGDIAVVNNLLPTWGELWNLPLPASPTERPVICCPDLGMVAAVSYADFPGLVAPSHTYIYVNPADFKNAMLLQAGLPPEGMLDLGFVGVPRLRRARHARTLHGGRVAFLNGANGEWTNKDDVRRRARASRRAPQRQQPRRRTRRRARVVGNSGLRLSTCSAKYARAIADPFNPAVVGVCVPVYPSPPSYKVSAHVRAFTVTVGTAGVGGAWFMPCIHNNLNCVFGTTATFSQTDLTMPAADPGAGTWNRSSFSTLPFASADAVEGRVISMAARVTYTGTTLDLSGMFASFVEPDHTHVTNVDLDQLAVLPYARVENTKRRMGNLTPIFGVKPSETVFSNRSYPIGDAPAGLGSWNAFETYGYSGFVVTGVPGTTFNVEMIEHVEYIGRSAAAGLSVSHTDSRGFEMVQQAGSQLASYLASSARAVWPTMRSLLLEAATDTVMSAAAGPTRRLRRIEL